MDIACLPTFPSSWRLDLAAINSCANSFNDPIRFALHRADGRLGLLCHSKAETNTGSQGSWWGFQPFRAGTSTTLYHYLYAVFLAVGLRFIRQLGISETFWIKIYTNIKPFPGEIISVFSCLAQMDRFSCCSLKFSRIANDVQPHGRGEASSTVIFRIKFRQILKHFWD